jgi:PKD domain
MRSEWERGEIDMITRSAKVGLTAVLLVVCMVTSSLVFLADASDNKGTDSGAADSGELKAKTGSKLVITGLPGTTDIGKSLGFTLSVLTKKGDLSKNYKGTVEFWSSDPSAVVPSPFTFSHSDKGQHTFNGSLIFYTAGIQTLTATDVRDPRLFGSATIDVIDTQTVLLSERFDSYGSLDPHWTIWNCQHPVYNSIDVSGGALRMTGTDAWYVDDNYNSKANWTYPITYREGLTISFRVYLPHDDDYKEGYYGQFVAVVLLDQAGTQRLITRFLMDTWFGAPNGFTYVSQENSWTGICGFTQGWHDCSFSLQAGSSTWTATFDGVTFPGLTFATEPWLASGLSKVVLVNALREEADVAFFDDVKIERSGPAPPEGGWQAPTQLQLFSDYEQMGSVGMDNDGDATVLWEQPFSWANYTNETPGVWSARYDHTSGWGTALKIWEGDYACGYTTLAVGPNGEALAAWFGESSVGVFELYVSRYFESMGWLAPTILKGVGLGMMDGDIDNSGNMMLVVSGNTGGALTAWRYDNYSGQWLNDVIPSGGASYPSVAFDSTGRALAAWTNFDNNQVESSWYVPGDGWSPMMRVSGPAGGYWVEMDVDETGTALATYVLYNGTAWELFGNIFDPINGWGVPTHIGPSAGGWHPSEGRVAAAGSLGEFFVVWQQTDSYGGTNWTIWSRNWTNWGGWSPAVRLSPTPSADSMIFPRIAASACGEAVVSWSQGSSVLKDVVVSRYDPVLGWGVPEVVDPSLTMNAYLGEVAMSPNGDTAVIWRQSDGENDLLWGRMYLHGAAPEPNQAPVGVITEETIEGLNASLTALYSYDPDGYIVGYSWMWGDGTPPTPLSTSPSANHTYPAPGFYTVRLQVTDNKGLSSFTYANINISVPEPIIPTIETTIYDMFEQPWGDWWTWRYPAYRNSIVLSNASGQSTMLYNPDTRGSQGIIYAPYRMNVSAFGLANLNALNPEFMPALTNSSSGDRSAEVNIYFEYLDQQWWDSYWVPTWSGNVNWPTSDVMAMQKADGYSLGVVYTVKMNRAAAESWLGMPSTVDPALWWANNSESYRSAWLNWLMNEGNNRLDIWAAYEWPLTDLGTMMDLDMSFDGTVTLSIGHLSWGFEILMTRWLSEAGICSHEPWYEDFVLDAHYDDQMAQWVSFDACCQYSLHAVRANETANGSAWVWDPNAIDYMASAWTGHPSRYDPYEIKTYTSWNAGDPMFGREVRYECTPTWFDLGDNSRLTFVLPQGNDVIGYVGTGVPSDAIVRIIRYGDFSAYNNITLHGEMSLGYFVTSNSSGGPDLNKMYDPVSKVLTIWGPMSFDNVRWPDGALYHGAPWIEFNVGGPVLPDEPPVANAGPDQYANGQDPILFNASGSHDDHGIVQYLWTWVAGNGSAKSLTGMWASCPAEWFFSYGNYTITLIVTDTVGQTDTDTFWIDFGFRIESSYPKAATGCNATMIGYYRMILENHGLTSMRVQVLDVLMPGPSVYVYDWTVTFPNASGPQTIITDPVWFNAGHYYQIEMTPHGTAGTYVILYDFFVKVHNTSTPAINVLRKSSISGGFKIEFTAPTSVVDWSNVTISLSDGTSTVSWSNVPTSALTSSSPPAVWSGGELNLGGLRVFLNVTDLAANGMMSNGDYVTLTTAMGSFSSAKVYYLILIFEPTAGQMLNYSFTG